MSAPAQATPQPSKLSLILAILNAALAGLAVTPLGGTISAEVSAFVGIYSAAAQLFKQETGQPIDLTLIPPETLVPPPPPAAS